ncbi:MAG: L-seryl-tRNA(Sec) selenium transferase, partial [Candidatus Eisenbacteria bacterium]|nr:L-seryl-tRNA(Sec) selenium transferase [Candidatus Eisenbacteria bacterium]
MEPKLQEQLRSLPGIDRVADQLDELPLDVGLKTALVRRVVERIRQEIRTGSSSRFEERDLSAEGVANQVRAYYQDLTQLRPQVVINATGVLVHTNLGRSPLSPKAVQHIAALGGKYSDLEFDLQSGGRGSRQSHVTELLCLLTGAEDALVVNNCAAAVYLMLAGLSHDKEVVISRGELVEIGGSFRIPDVLRHSGAKLREVGTTNRTHLKDFVEAITGDTGLLLQVHTSNYRVEGFTAAVPLS